jgi:hypothetical protein
MREWISDQLHSLVATEPPPRNAYDGVLLALQANVTTGNQLAGALANDHHAGFSRLLGRTAQVRLQIAGVHPCCSATAAFLEGARDHT